MRTCKNHSCFNLEDISACWYTDKEQVSIHFDGVFAVLFVLNIHLTIIELQLSAISSDQLADVALFVIPADWEVQKLLASCSVT